MRKRLQLLYTRQMVRIISDNSKYEPMEADPGQIKINRKVIWFGRKIESNKYKEDRENGGEKM